MKEKRRKLPTLLLILTLFLSSIAIAQDAFEISTTGSDSAALCPRDIGLFVNVVTNTNSHEQEYTLTLEGSASSWATTVPTGFLLGPGEEKTLYTYVTPSRNALPGEYKLELVVTAGGDTTSTRHDVTVKDCFQADLSSKEAAKAVCPAQVTKFTLKLKNTGSYREDYILRVEGQLKDQVSLSDDIVSLASGENKKIYAYITAPKDKGEYGFSVIAEGSSGKSIQSLTHILEVQGCYDFDVNLEGKNSYQFCERTVNRAEIEIKNEGTTTNTYTVDVDGPSWAQLEHREVTLLAGAKTKVDLIMAPNYGVEGEFTADLSIVPERGDQKATTEINMNIRKCHSVNIDLLQNQVKTCNNGQEATYEALVVNDGEVDKEYAFELKGPGWIETDAENIFELEAGEEKKIQIFVNPGQDARAGDYDILLKVNATDESSVTVFDSDVLELETVDTEACYEPVLSTNYQDIVVYFDSSVVVPVSIQNIGLEEAKYEIVLSGDAVSFSRIAPGVVTVTPGRTETAFIYIAPGPQSRLGNYELGVSAKLEDSNLLASRKINLRLTDVEEEATPLEKLQERQDEITGGAVGVDSGAWQRFKNWLNKLFSPKEPLEEATEDVEDISTDVAETEEETDEDIIVNVDLEEITNLEPEADEEDAPLDEGSEDIIVNVDESTSDAESETPESAPDEEGLETITGETTKDTGTIAKFINKNRYWILGIIVLILLLIILARLDAHKKIKGYYYDEIDDDDDE